MDPPLYVLCVTWTVWPFSWISNGNCLISFSYVSLKIHSLHFKWKLNNISSNYLIWYCWLCVDTWWYDELGWEPLHLRRTRHKLYSMCRFINGIAPNYLYEVIHPFFQVCHSHNLRSGFKNLCLPICKTVSYYYSFSPSTIKLGIILVKV